LGHESYPSCKAAPSSNRARKVVPMSFIRGFRNVALSIFMVSLAQAACGPMPEESTSGESQTATNSSQQIRSEPSHAASTFDLALSVNNKKQSAHTEVSPEALRALGMLHRTSAGEAPIKSIVQERIQRAINEGTLQLPEGAEPRINVKAQLELAPAFEGVSSADPCFVPALINLWYTYVYQYPTCTYYYLVDHYDGFYNQCDGSYVLTTYLGSDVFGPYSCN
jgi:hypothetical protein